MSDTAIERDQFYYEAREYCDRFEIEDPTECERVRRSMAYREWKERMRPWQAALIRMACCNLAIDSPEYISARAIFDEMAAYEAARLGLEIRNGDA